MSYKQCKYVFRCVIMNLFRKKVCKLISGHPWIATTCVFACLYVIFSSSTFSLTGSGCLYGEEYRPDQTVPWKQSGNVDDGIDYIAKYLDVFIHPPDNFALDEVQLVSLRVDFRNNGSHEIKYGQWAIYFNSFIPVKPENLDCGMTTAHVNGGLHYVLPLQSEFVGIKAGATLTCQFHLPYSVIARSDFLPNWYVAYMKDRLGARVIVSTADDELKHVGTFDTPNQWKSRLRDKFNPYTPESRYRMNKISESAVPRIVVPTPKTVKKLPGKGLVFDTQSWKVLSSAEFHNEAKYLSDKLLISQTSQKPQNKFIELKHSSEILEEEGYHLVVNSTATYVSIMAKSSSGAFYGVQSLLSILAADDSILPAVEIRDKPRYPYRGVMIDVARNFQYKESIFKLIDAMATYKLNKLHLHLSDDEGWRLEIPDLPELVEIGSRRCHQQPPNLCLIPSLGSGPDPTHPGSGFYTKDDYREILMYANNRHVQVIPEIDMPGHARAAVYSMERREMKYRQANNLPQKSSYLLSEDHMPVHQSVQHWLGNAMNPCLNSTYMFIEKILDTLITFHRGIQELKLFHFGGDEVAKGAWDNSEACQLLMGSETPVRSGVLKMFFAQAVAEIARTRGLGVAAWEDGMYHARQGPFPREELKNNDIYVIPWSNVWETGTGGRAIEFADNGYKVILSMATHLYFDHPYEPDPEERGLHWATRYTDTRKTFGFTPEDIFANADVNRVGEPYDLADLCNNQTCPKTKHPENIAGIQGCLWGETIRSSKHLQYMAFPRLLALAERAWHKAAWEYIESSEDQKRRKQRDWESFVKTLGDKELPRLEKNGIRYRVPIPGAELEGDILHVNTLYPNHYIESSIDGDTWSVIAGDTLKLKPGIISGNILLRARTKHQHRTSRAINMAINGSSQTGKDILHSWSYIYAIYLMYIFIIK